MLTTEKIMKILLATPIYPPEIGGPATYIKELCERLHDKHEITVIAYASAQAPFEGTKLIAIDKQQPLYKRLPAYLFKLIKIAKDFDVVYVQNAMAAGFPVAIACSLLRVPFVLKFVGDEAWERATQRRLTSKKLEDFLQSPEGDYKIRMMMRIQGWVLRRASIVTTPSAYLSEEIIKAYRVPRARAIVNYNASENSEILPFDAQRVPHQLVTTARLVIWKGIDGIIRAVALLKKKIPDVMLMVAGDGPELENLKTLANQLGVSENVVFKGNVSRAETWQLRKKSSVYVLNSTYEGLPHVVLTSFAAGIPVVSTDISGTNEAVYHEDTGLLVKPGDDRGLADAIARLFADRALAEKLVQNGTKLLKTKFSWEAHLEKLDEILKSVAAKPVN